jgi:hypothetical protein
MSRCFVYWEGPLPDYIARCLRSIERVCQQTQFTLVTPMTLAMYVPSDTLHPYFAHLHEPAQRADCIRAALLAHHGGFYFDADTVGLRDPGSVASDHDLVYCVWDNQPRRVLNGYIYARPGSLLAAKWLAAINQRLADLGDGQPQHWAALGEGILTQLVADADPATVRQVPRHTFLPIDVDRDVQRFFKSGDPRRHITPASVCYGLNHSYFWANRREVFEPLKRGPMLIQKLLASYTSP